MNWLRNFVRPKLRAVLRQKDTPDNLWHKCRNCDQMIFHKEFKANLKVCPHCDHHERMSPEDRFEHLFDNGKYDLLALPEVPVDPLKFRDKRKYTERLKTSRSQTGRDEAVAVARGALDGMTVVMAAHDFAFMGGSMGMATGGAILAAAEEAVGRHAPLIVISAAGGARMQEGILSLMQMPRTTVAINMVRDAGLPYLVVLTDPTTGGVTASYAMLGDIAIAEPRALIGFAGPRVIENTIHEELPEGFQRAEFLLEHGMLDMVVHRRDLRDTLIRILTLTAGQARAPAPVQPPAPDIPAGSPPAS